MDDPQNKQHTDVVGQGQTPQIPADQNVQPPQQPAPATPVASDPAVYAQDPGVQQPVATPDPNYPQTSGGQPGIADPSLYQGTMPSPPSPSQTPGQPQPVPYPEPAVPQPVDQPAMPTGNLAKEQLPPIAPDIMPAEHHEQPVNLEQELQEAGVEQVPQVEHPQLTLEDKRDGLEPAKASVPVSSVTGQNVQLPFTQERAESLRKTTPIGDSLRWLVESVIYQLKKTHAQLMQKEVK